MSALEYEEWKVFIRHEELHPADERMRHAQLLAAAFQGPQHRQSRKPWLASDFMRPNPWAALAGPRSAANGSAARLMLKAMSRRGRR